MRDKIQLGLVYTAFLIGIVFFLLNQYQIIFFPFQHEYREGAIIPIVNLLKEFQNPYSTNNLPQAFYAYGFGFPLFVALFDFVLNPFGISTLETARLLTTLCILAGSIFVFIILKKKNVNISIAIVAVSVFIYEQIILSNFAFPNSCAVLFLIAGYFIADYYNFSNKSTAFSLLIFLVGFYIKQYVLLGAVILLCYYTVFINCKRGLIFICAFSISFGLCVVLINNVFELYFSVSYYAIKGSNISSFNHLKNQLNSFVGDNFLYFVALILFIFCYLSVSNIKKVNSLNAVFDELRKGGLFLFAFLGGLGAFVVKLGWHEGSCCATYLYHIMTPFLIILIAQFLSNYINKSYINTVSIVLLITFTVKIHSRYIENYHRLKSMKPELEAIQSKVLKYRSIYNSPEVSSIVAQTRNMIYNNGSTEYFRDALNVKDQSKYAVIESTHENFIQKIKEEIDTKKFEAILQTKNYFGFNYMDRSLLEQNYSFKETVYFQMLLGSWEVEIWERK